MNLVDHIIDEQQWHPAKGDYLFPVRALSRCFRGKMVSALRLASQSSILPSPKTINQMLDVLMSKDWVVYAKSTLNKAQSVVAYLARYAKKAAISNSRITSVDDNTVQFDWKDYRDERQKTMALSGEEFIRRYLLHILPKGFMRIRHFGFLANRCRAAKLHGIKDKIQACGKATTEDKQEKEKSVVPNLPAPQCKCPKCRQGNLITRYEISPKWKVRRC